MHILSTLFQVFPPEEKNTFFYQHNSGVGKRRRENGTPGKPPQNPSENFKNPIAFRERMCYNVMACVPDVKAHREFQSEVS